MANDREDEEVLLLLLLLRRLATLEWFDFYTTQERKIGRLWHRVLAETKRAERRASMVYQDRISGFTSDLDAGPTLISAPVSASMRAERAIRDTVGRSLGEGGAVHRMTLAEMRRLHRAGVDQVASHLDDLNEFSLAIDADRDFGKAASAAKPVKSAGPSSWAMRRDLEVLSDRTAHRAALSMYSASQGQRLSSALREASQATRVSRRSIRNSSLGAARQSLRAAVYAGVGAAAVFGNWAGIRNGTVTAIHPESSWISTAAKEARGESWRPGNPISGYGLHVGSKTFFAPVISEDRLRVLADRLAVVRPGLIADIAIGKDVTDPPVFRGKPVRSIDELLSAMQADFIRERGVLVPPSSNEKMRGTGEVVGIFGSSEPRIYTIRAGRDKNVALGMRLSVFSRDRSVRKGVLVITSVYPTMSSGRIVVYDTLLPKLFDVAVSE